MTHPTDEQIALMHAAADECMSPEQRDIFDQLGDRDNDVFARLFRCVVKRVVASEPVVAHACALCGSTGDCKSTDARTLHECGGAWYRPAAPVRSGEPVDCHEVDHGTHIEMVPHVGEPAQTVPSAVVLDDGRAAFERALFELVNKIDTGLDTGDLLKDAKRASAALDSILSGGDLVACAHEYFRDSGERYEKSIEFRIGWNACLDAIVKARAASPQPVAQTEQSTDSEFKNFHRLLCERFDYTHDDRDWKRDQLSLIEWIARTAQCGEPVAWMNPNENFSKDAFLWAPDDWQFEYSVPVYAAPIAAQREMTDEQREAIATSVTALTTLGWTHQVPVLIALLKTAQPAKGQP